MWYEGTDEQSACPGKSNFLAHDELDTSDNLTTFWEVEGSIPMQISDIQGRLKQKVLIWKEFYRPLLLCYIVWSMGITYCLSIFLLTRNISQRNCTTYLYRRQSLVYLKNDVCKWWTINLMYVCSPLSAFSNAAGKLRLVLNLRYLNQLLHVVRV